ncbi:hypothetical protein Z043_120836 [Scleropages formosus]|uniref:Acid-sensing ion channel 2-like n=1 Tax=Scleropages formosus TaxID=113540 RepID=A0A0P7WIQ6_SCLFO|nr:hypothetical protein Z043_120836 [Scleropages formosus]
MYRFRLWFRSHVSPSPAADETSLEAGIRVQIHSQDEPPYIHELGFGISPGFQTFVSCQEQRVGTGPSPCHLYLLSACIPLAPAVTLCCPLCLKLTYLPQPWGNCQANSEKLIRGYDTYSISACRLQCETSEVVKHCNCRMVHMPGVHLSPSPIRVPVSASLSFTLVYPGNTTICPPNKIKCVDDALVMLQKKSSSFCPCQTPCSLTRYGKELSMVKIPSRGSARYLAKRYNKSEEYIRDNFLVLDIFFEALNYETIEQKKAYDVASLLGDIGGQMGLFIGASVLTILEIFDYIYEVIGNSMRLSWTDQTWGLQDGTFKSHISFQNKCLFSWS